MKVLIAEDDEILVQSLQKMVQRWGHEVLCAADGAEAWRRFDEHDDVDLVISDWMMPGLSGVELIQRIRAAKRPGYVYFILLTARSGTEDIVQGMEAGADDFLTKPFDRNELHVRLRAGQRIVELEHNLARRNAELEAVNERMHQDLEAAAELQGALLPKEVPNCPEARFAWAFKPCEELSGDGLGLVPLDERHVALYVLDVSGHGVAAALLSVSVHHVLSPVYSLSSLLRQPTAGWPTWRIVPPAEVAAELNRRFPMENGRYFTFLYGVLDLDRREFRYVTAGHLGPAYLPAGAQPVLLEGAALPIGVDPSARYTERVLSMNPGDRLYLFSDGIWEAMDMDKQQFGPTQLLSILRENRDLPVQKHLDLILERVMRWCGRVTLKDDASLLAVELGEANP